MIRAARPSDHEALLDLWEGLQGNGREADPRYRPTSDARAQMRLWTASSWFEQHPFPRVLLYEVGEDLAGFIHGFPRAAVAVVELAPTARIGDLYVAEPHRRAGRGRALVQEFARLARGAGYPRLEVGTLTADERAVDFWRAMGFGDWQISLVREP